MHLTFALIVASVGAYQVWVTRTWPPQILHPGSRHYHVLAAPAEMARLPGGGPSATEINAAGQVLIYRDTRSMLFVPPGVDGPDAQVVDFNAVLGVPSDKGLVAASALNAYGQVAGFVEWPGASPRRSALFLWTPRAANSAEGTLIYLTDPQGKRPTRCRSSTPQARSPSHRKTSWFCGRPKRPMGYRAQPILSSLLMGQTRSVCTVPTPMGKSRDAQVDGRLSGHRSSRRVRVGRSHGSRPAWTRDGLNDFGQVVGHDADDQRSQLWTPDQPNATTGRLTSIPKPSTSLSMRFVALSAQGALAGLARDGSYVLGNGPRDDAVVWLPDGPNSPTGQLRILGALSNTMVEGTVNKT